MLSYFRAPILILVAALAGCATSPKQTAPTREPGQLQYWQASGRLAVSGANGGGSGSFIWQQRGSEADVQLRGPIGIGSLKLLISDDALRIDTGEQVLEAGEAQAELTARLGADVPTQALRYWLIGQAAPGEHTWVQNGESAILDQNAWRIDYQKYGATDGVRVPTKFVATSGPAKVRIVIDRWRLHE
jgi:outer membrane lipoprotein LolB